MSDGAKTVDPAAWESLNAERILEKAFETFDGRLVFASSMGKEDQVLTDLIAKSGLKIDIITLDTGRLFPETYDLIEETNLKYGLKIRAVFPDGAAVQGMIDRDGVNLFRKDIEHRKLCCRIRKIEPLKKALAGYGAWLCGLRREQSENRSSLPKIVKDETFGLWKISPLADWSDEELDAYVEANGVPVSPLHSKGFPSIGCAPCTRAVAPGEHPRAGRWWWEADCKRECGLHFSNGKLVRKSDPAKNNGGFHP